MRDKPLSWSYYNSSGFLIRNDLLSIRSIYFSCFLLENNLFEWMLTFWIEIDSESLYSKLDKLTRCDLWLSIYSCGLNLTGSASAGFDNFTCLNGIILSIFLGFAFTEGTFFLYRLCSLSNWMSLGFTRPLWVFTVDAIVTLLYFGYTLLA